MDNVEYNKSNLYNDDNFELHSISVGDLNIQRSKDKSDSICVLMFDLNESGKIINLYLLKQMDYINDGTCLSCLIEDINHNIDDDSFDTFKRCIDKDLAIKNVNVDSCYYLGKINHNVPFSKTYSCYGLCLNDYIKSPEGFKLDMPESEIDGKTYSIEKMKFSRAIKGECSDSLVLSSCMLLISYIS
jgi:hypothetical protein